MGSHKSNLKKSTPRYITIKLSKTQRQRVLKERSHICGLSNTRIWYHKIINRFLGRYLACHKGIKLYILSAQRKILPTKNTIVGKTVLPK